MNNCEKNWFKRITEIFLLHKQPRLFVVMWGILAGLLLLIFVTSNTSSYLSDQSETCVNCHVMNSFYATWMHSSHRERANCNDCHVPHNNIINKYYFKARDGLRHSFVFTFKLEPQVIRIKDAGKQVVQNNCIRCHVEQIRDVAILNNSGSIDGDSDEKLCWDCHRELPHSRVHSLAASHNAPIMNKSYSLPSWLRNLTK